LVLGEIDARESEIHAAQGEHDDDDQPEGDLDEKAHDFS
jgi:hypothetical protein